MTTIADLIEQLHDYALAYGDDVEVRIAEQPRYPLENEIDGVDIVDQSEEECKTCDGAGEVEAGEDDQGELIFEDCPDCEDGMRNNKDAQPIVYIKMGNQIGYLSGAACKSIGWR